MLFIVSTPIGNLGDLTYRAVEVLKECHHILCEDTRHSLTLLRHYGIEKTLVSYHQHNESLRTSQTLEELRQGYKIALLSDAGTPTIADPGQRLIEACHAEAIPVSPIPGPCAAIAALSAAGLPSTRFQFIGFLPKTSFARHSTLLEALKYPGTTVCYESPHRLLKSLTALSELAPTALIVVARELTKHYEEVVKNSAEALTVYYTAHPPKGEIVLLIDGSSALLKDVAPEISPCDAVIALQEQGYTLSAAIKEVASQRGINKRALYQQLHTS